MKIHYDPNSGEWFQSRLDRAVTFGGQKQLLAKMLETNSSTSFNVRENSGRAGPLIGIITARKADGTVSGNSRLFIDLQKKLLSLKGLSFIFTADGLQKNHINGYIYLPNEQVWVKMKFPFPDLVYNRIPFRFAEETEAVRSVFETLKDNGIPFFNPCFLDKHLLHSLFQNHPILARLVPETELVTDSQQLELFLLKHASAYLKPSQSSKGKGIFLLSNSPPQKIVLESLTKKQTYLTVDDFWNEYGQVLIAKNYLIQQAIPSARLNDKRFDFRILAHANGDDYQVTGVGIRQSQEQELTTHIPNGGKLLPYSLVQTPEHDQFIQLAADQIGKLLTKELGFFGEFSIDAGISQTGEYWIYEVNSKPMRFDEAEIEEQKIFQLCRLFIQLTHFE